MGALNNGTSTTFMRLGHEGRTEEVVRRMIEVIELGVFAEGEQLPSESELAQQFGVATVTLREALAVLRQRGLIETRRGRKGGSFIRAPREVSQTALLERLRQMSLMELRDLGDELAAISTATARLAARRATTEHHVRLRHQVEALGNAATRLERRRADAHFHIEIAVASQSVRLTNTQMRLQAEVGELFWIDSADTPDIAAIQRQQRALLDALEAGDVQLAGELAEAKVTRSIKRLINLRLEQLAEEEIDG
ncbi:FadR/GntR family transcriptional regulator [Stutzerimonas kirkiae]|uniref:GntR family transcriptional regulator n=1 Tax=Stutzerimonas kirkiae TaxID=2211392 RepID=A0A4Q9R050_9GAMM|nr:GntR family transcriptional regulator [Stutzerimonas kirkiae]TBU91987.1 GntR family transcriptional regulator [Stutzerimonas kirkiae]TBU99462.1 GntR family transcriptional regulator [Stutzerimonas kirkiae]TBV05547.1 GntR family transcriptional regulator [Stutzerimonas kirkiae]TBV10713.1 GntR family transcriptional regulator [Stutzerimonas kirkiae]